MTRTPPHEPFLLMMHISLPLSTKVSLPQSLPLTRRRPFTHSATERRGRRERGDGNAAVGKYANRIRENSWLRLQ